MIYNNEERVGIHSIAKIIVEDLGWIFKEQPTNDFGLDGFVEITKYSLDLKNRVPTGKLLGIQVKSGKSYFKEIDNNHYVFRGLKKHLDYWLNYSIPVIVVIYDKISNIAYWQIINSSTIRLTKKSFKINVSKNNRLTKKCIEPLIHSALFKDIYQYKIWQITSSIDEILLLQRAQLFLYVEIDGIPNSNNFGITLIVTDAFCEETFAMIHQYGDPDNNRFYYHFYLAKGQSLKEAIADMLPWADAHINGSVFSDQLLTEHLANGILYFDQDEFCKDIFELRNKNSFLDLACYLSGSSAFMLELKANDVSDSFLAINKFLKKKPTVLQRTFL